MSVRSWLEHAEQRRGADWVRMVEEFIADIPHQPPGGIVFVGDSLTQAFPFDDLLAGFPIINRGIAGDMINGMAERLQVSAVALHSSQVFIMGGTNDIFKTDQTLEMLKFQWFAILPTLLGSMPHAEIVVQSVVPFGAAFADKNELVRGVNRALFDLSNFFALKYVDLYALMADGAGVLRPELTTDDIHLTRAGYEVWADAVRPLLGP